MKYLIIPLNEAPFLTDWFEFENHFSEGMIVINTNAAMYTKDGLTWNQIKRDHL